VPEDRGGAEMNFDFDTLEYRVKVRKFYKALLWTALAGFLLVIVPTGGTVIWSQSLELLPSEEWISFLAVTILLGVVLMFVAVCLYVNEQLWHFAYRKLKKLRQNVLDREENKDRQE
jgi:uncharacterized membrane protein